MAAGEGKFSTDGYSEFRGRFDRASLSAREPDAARRSAILALSDDHGAVVRAALPLNP
jgi:hypothetical protein